MIQLQAKAAQFRIGKVKRERDRKKKEGKERKE